MAHSGEHSLVLSNGADSIDLYPWLHRSPEGIEALAGITGFGAPPQQHRWFEGAGHGAAFRGTRVLPRLIDMPFVAEAHDREALLALLSKMASILNSVYRGQARLAFMLPDGEQWALDVVREDGLDWSRTLDSDNETYVKSLVTLKAGDPFWTRLRPERFTIRTETVVGLLPMLAQLRVTPTGTFGTREVSNTGDAPAYAKWTLTGPFDQVTLIGPGGEVLQWDKDNSESGLGIGVGEGLIITTTPGRTTVKDLDGVNRYDGLSSSPRFWSIAPGLSQVTVAMAGTSPDSAALAEWQPRRWLVV